MENWIEPLSFNKYSEDVYRNTIEGLSSGERIFIYFEKIRFTSQKTIFLNFCFLAKINQ